jgi:hypothetical protein
MSVIESADHLEVDQAGLYCEWHIFTSTVASFPTSSVKISARAATVGVEVECGGASGASYRFSTPSRSARVRSVGLLWRWRTSCPEPVAPTPSYSAARQGPTSLLTSWVSPIRTRIKGQWAVGGEINLTFSPWSHHILFNFFSHSITNQCIEHVLSSRSISFLSISDRFNGYNTHLCTETNSHDLGPFIAQNLKLYHKPMLHMCSLSALGDILFVRGSSSTCLSLICTIHLIWFQTYSFTTYNFVSMCLTAHLTCCHRSELL